MSNISMLMNLLSFIDRYVQGNCSGLIYVTKIYLLLISGWLKALQKYSSLEIILDFFMIFKKTSFLFYWLFWFYSNFVE